MDTLPEDASIKAEVRVTAVAIAKTSNREMWLDTSRHVAHTLACLNALEDVGSLNPVELRSFTGKAQGLVAVTIAPERAAELASNSYFVHTTWSSSEA